MVLHHESHFDLDFLNTHGTWGLFDLSMHRWRLSDWGIPFYRLLLEFGAKGLDCVHIAAALIFWPTGRTDSWGIAYAWNCSLHFSDEEIRSIRTEVKLSVSAPAPRRRPIPVHKSSNEKGVIKEYDEQLLRTSLAFLFLCSKISSKRFWLRKEWKLSFLFCGWEIFLAA